MKAILFITIYLFSLCVHIHAAPLCSATVDTIPRSGGSWVISGQTYQIYDLTATNTGACAILSLSARYSGSLTQVWNYNANTGAVSLYGNPLLSGQSSIGAGFVYAGSTVPNPPIVSSQCDPSCAGTGSTTGSETGSTTGSQAGSTTGSDATTGSTTGSAATTGSSATTGSPATTGTTGSSSTTTGGSVTCGTEVCGPNQVCIEDGGISRCVTESTSCNVLASISARSGSSFDINGSPSQIYDIVVQNIGTAAVSNLVLLITPVPDTQIVQGNKWNLVQISTSDQYTVETYGGLTLPNSQYTGAGFVLSGTNSTTATPSLSVYSVSC